MCTCSIQFFQRHSNYIELFLFRVRYLQLCPDQVNTSATFSELLRFIFQRLTEACDPKDIDKFVEHHTSRGDNISRILSKVRPAIVF